MTALSRLFLGLPLCAGLIAPALARADEPNPPLSNPRNPISVVPPSSAATVPMPVSVPVPSDPLPLPGPPPSFSVPCPPAGPPSCSTGRCAPAVRRTPKVLVEMSQPEVQFVAPRGAPTTVACGGTTPACNAPAPCGTANTSKSSSFLNLSFNRTKLCGSGVCGPMGGVGGAGVPQAVTTVVPAFATATIPIAFQTTQFTAAAQSALLGTAQSAGLTQTEAAALIRDAVRKELAARESAERESAARQETAPRTDSCADLKARVDAIEKKVDAIEKKVDAITAKLSKLP